MPTLTIKNVDFSLLEDQIKALGDLVCKKKDGPLTPKDREALEGLLNMLDSWRDTRIKHLEKEALDWLQNPTDADLDVIREHMAEFVEWLDKQPEDAKQTNFWQWYETT